MPGPCCVAFPSFTRPQQDAVGVLRSTATELPPPVSLQVQGVGSRGWRDVTTFFSGRAEDPSDRYAGPPCPDVGLPSPGSSCGVSGRQLPGGQVYHAPRVQGS